MIGGDGLRLAARLHIDPTRKLAWIDAAIGPCGQAQQRPFPMERRLLGNTPHTPNGMVAIHLLSAGPGIIFSRVSAPGLLLPMTRSNAMAGDTAGSSSRASSVLLRRS